MNRWQKRKKSGVQYTLSTLLFGGLVLCLLLSACSIVQSGNTTSSTHAIISAPAIDGTLKKQGEMQLQAFQQWIALMRQYSGNATTYQQQYTSDQQALQNAKTTTAYKAALAVLNGHVEAIKLPAMKTESLHLQQQLQQQVKDWGQQHTYHDSYNNTTYPLGYEYGPTGIGGWVQDELNSSTTMADYQQTVEDLNMYLTNFQALMANSSDTTSYNQPHQSDLQLIQHYNKMNSKVVIISLQEQAIRVYDRGKLVNSFLVTTGRPDKPSIPGVWWVEGKQSPTVFKSPYPPGSPYWYPNTPINYAMQYHSQGYFVHDSWWRADYGPGTNFPHPDSSGDTFSAYGTHGCVNVAKDNAAWLYGFVQLYTSIIIY